MLDSVQESGEHEAPVRVLMRADPSCREDLQAEAEVDPMDGEQTWPTETELLEAEGPKSPLQLVSLIDRSVFDVLGVISVCVLMKRRMVKFRTHF